MPSVLAAQGANPANAAAVAVVQPLGLRSPVADALVAALLRTSSPGRLSMLPDASCADTRPTARLVDLNSDPLPEVHVTADGACWRDNAGDPNWVFVYNPTTKTWANVLFVQGTLQPLRSGSGSFPDLIAGGLDASIPVWRWTGTRYQRFCLDGSNGGADTCPRGLADALTGETLPTFVDAPSSKPCDDPRPVTFYDVSSPTYHRYGAYGSLTAAVCVTTTPGCTADRVFQIMLTEARFVAPTFDTTPVADCRETRVMIGPIPNNPILTVVNGTTRTVVNYTLPGHTLHPGTVQRQIVQRDNTVYVVTGGEGTGDFQTANVLFSPTVWGVVDWQLRSAVKAAGIPIVDQ